MPDKAPSTFTTVNDPDASSVFPFVDPSRSVGDREAIMTAPLMKAYWLQATIESITASATISGETGVVLVDATAGAVVVTLPDAADRTQSLTVKKTDSSANTVTIDGAGAETIDSAATAVITTQFEAITIVSDLTEWWIL